MSVTAAVIPKLSVIALRGGGIELRYYLQNVSLALIRRSIQLASFFLPYFPSLWQVLFIQ